MKTVHYLIRVASLAVILAFGAGCGSIGTARVGKISCLKSHHCNAMTNAEPALFARSYLVAHALDDRYEDDPEQVFAVILERFETEKQRLDLSALIEICMHQSRHTAGEVRTRWLWRTARYSYVYFFAADIRQPVSYNPMRGSMIGQYYNYAVGELFNRVKSQVMSGRKSGVLTAEKQHYRCYFDTEFLGFSPELFSAMDECLKYIPYGLISSSSREAVGAPYIGIIGNFRRSPLLSNPYFSRDNTVPLTVFARFDLKDPHRVQFEIYNTLIREYAVVGKRKIMLSFDFSTPLAKLMEDPPPLGPLYLLFKPDAIADARGIFLLAPYDPDKIPVVFVHGLMSNPRTWTQTVNVLLNDPRLRQRYHFWLFAYATGNQILYSAELLRQSLKETQTIFDPAGTNPHFNHMVLVGHSMGGILSKAMIQNSGTALVDSMLAEPVEQLKITAEQKKFLREMLEFRRLPFIGRVIFIASPHRGSTIAVWSVSRWAASLIELPETFTRNVRDISRQLLIKAKLRANDNPDYVATGIDNLSPDSEALQALQRLPIDPAVTYHSIVGNRNGDGIVGGSDGVVPYSSSHLDGAASELIVKSGHSVQDTPKGIQEIKRILLLHLREVDAAENKK
ncbi:MAG: alpha/beta fold hydrolase [Victivallales bacterium]|nr:alpha/beta fold hydrolase [Victivallales bacterium]